MISKKVFSCGAEEDAYNYIVSQLKLRKDFSITEESIKSEICRVTSSIAEKDYTKYSDSETIAAAQHYKRYCEEKGYQYSDIFKTDGRIPNSRKW